MSIEEAIKHCREVSKAKCGKCSEEHEQLAKWLEELVSLRSKIKELEDALFEAGERCYEADRNRFMSEIVNENMEILKTW